LSTENNPIESFFNRIDTWIHDNKLDIQNKNFNNIEEILSLEPDQLKELTPEELMNNAYSLYGYAEHVQSIYNKEKTIIDFADESIWFIISPVLNNYGDQFTKWQTKYAMAVKESILASKLNQLKNNAQARLNMIEKRADHIKKMADIMLDIAKRRKYDYTSNS
jgi:hypothetical protein